MTTPEPKKAKTPSKSAGPGSGGFRFKSTTGEIPGDAFENEPGPPRDPATFMPEQDLADFDAETQELLKQLGRKPAA